jgi:hypothetical protein
MGVYPETQVDQVAAALYANGVHQDATHVTSLVAFGSSESPEMRKRYPEVPQVLWPQVKRFIHGRFVEYLREKAWHQTWDEVGEGLYKLVEREHDVERFCQLLEVVPKA